MVSKLSSAALHGIEAVPVQVEVDIGPGLPGTLFVGLPNASLRESRDRIRAAIRNAKFRYPDRKVLVNLAPGDLRKEGPSFDLAIALAILQASRQCAVGDGEGESFVVLGELGLEGEVRPVPGVLAVARSIRRERRRRILLVPRDNAAEAALVDGLRYVAVATLADAVAALAAPDPLIAPARPADCETRAAGADDPGDGASDRLDGASVGPCRASDRLDEAFAGGPENARCVPAATGSPPDFADVIGQEIGKRAAMLVAAGGHNLLMTGPPGAGKSLIARRLPGILPPLADDEALDVTLIHGLRSPGATGLTRRPPFRAPHHSISLAGLVGGGPSIRPGEITLAHHGVLFLDELGEFPPRLLETLRQPLEEGEIRIVRATQAVTFPANFILVAAMNPCACGHRGSMTRDCLCTPQQVQRYAGRISGPLLDRFDLQLELTALLPEELAPDSRVGGDASGARDTRSMRREVDAARARQARRFDGTGVRHNAGIPHTALDRWCRLGGEEEASLRLLCTRGDLSARGAHRLRRVARTIADLEGREEIAAEHLAEAFQFRFREVRDS